MLRPLHGFTLLLRSRPFVAKFGPGVATAAYIQHPNPGNFANRSQEELSAIGHQGGKKGGKARATGGFHNMDPKKQRGIISKGGRATEKAAAKFEEALEETKTRPTLFGSPSEEPSVVPPAYPQWKTSS
ncbi:Conidiation-specific protein Con-10 [Penicillium atrosanguineum]|nr:Conidiation-specific protein Con-10 [Penicillium atrosanguineum]